LLLKATTFKFILLAAGMSIVASDGIAQTTARDYCNRGVARQKKGDLDGALADYNRAIELNPQDATPYNNRGLVKATKGDLDGALADYDRAVQLSPRNYQIHGHRGIVRQRKGDLDGALTDYDIAIKLWWKYVGGYNNRASVKISKNDLEGALADCNRAIALDPKYAAAYNTRALIERAKGELDAATADFNRAIKLDPKYARNSPAAVNKGKVESAGAPDENRPIEPNAKNLDAGKNRDLAAQKKDDLKGARPEPDYAPPIEIEPKNIAAVYDRDVAKRKNDDQNGAAVDHKPAIELPPKTVGVHDDGNVGRKTGVGSANPGPTVELPSKSVETSSSLEQPPAEPTVPNIPSDADLTKQNKADLNIVLADHSRAPEPNNLKAPEEASVATQKDNLSRDSADYDRSTEPDPTSAVGYDNRAQFRKATGDLNGALADYNRAIQLDPKYAAAYNGRGNIKQAKSDLDGALADYNRAIELNGGNAIAYYNRGVTKQTNGDLDGALADFNPAIQLDPKNAAAYNSRGVARTMKGDLDGALADYNRAIELDPKDAATHNNRAGLFFLVRNWGAALEDYNRFFELSKEGQEDPRLYVWLIRARTAQTDAANKELVDYLQQRGNTADWFSTVASYLLGRISDADLLAAAKSSDKKKENGQLCEALFYIGMKKLIAGDKSGAQDCFNKSLATDQKDYTEYHFARAELKALPN
jgi:tetratricopeptide (TPR) repeat protein